MPNFEHQRCDLGRGRSFVEGYGGIVRSNAALSISMRPSVKNWMRPSEYLAMYLRASPVGDFTETCVLG